MNNISQRTPFLLYLKGMVFPTMRISSRNNKTDMIIDNDTNVNPERGGDGGKAIREAEKKVLDP